MGVTLPSKSKLNTMMAEKISREVLVMRAKHLDRYCELLIEQCENWLAPIDYDEEFIWRRKKTARKREKSSDQKSK